MWREECLARVKIETIPIRLSLLIRTTSQIPPMISKTRHLRRFMLCLRNHKSASTISQLNIDTIIEYSSSSPIKKPKEARSFKKTIPTSQILRQMSMWNSSKNSDCKWCRKTRKSIGFWLSSSSSMRLSNSSSKDRRRKTLKSSSSKKMPFLTIAKESVFRAKSGDWTTKQRIFARQCVSNEKDTGRSNARKTKFSKDWPNKLNPKKNSLRKSLNCESRTSSWRREKDKWRRSYRYTPGNISPSMVLAKP